MLAHYGKQIFVCVCGVLYGEKVGGITYILHLWKYLWHPYSVCILLQLLFFSIYWEQFI